MASTHLVRTWWSAYWADGYDVRVPFLGREGAKMTNFTLPAWRALEAALMANGYGTASIVSTYYPRPIGGYTCDMDNGGYGCSLHGYSGCAMDIDPALNPYIRGTRWDFSRCKFTKKQVDAVLAIRTNSGAQVFRWGGDFGDYMHWQMNCRPEDIKTGINPATVPEWDGLPISPPIETGGEDVRYVKYSDGFNTTNGDEDVRYWQTLLVALGQDTRGIDGKYGGGTKSAVANVTGQSGDQIGGVEAAIIHIAIGNLSEGGTPVNAYTKSESDALYVRKGTQFTASGRL